MGHRGPREQAAGRASRGPAGHDGAVAGERPARTASPRGQACAWVNFSDSTRNRGAGVSLWPLYTAGPTHRTPESRRRELSAKGRPHGGRRRPWAEGFRRFRVPIGGGSALQATAPGWAPQAAEAARKGILTVRTPRWGSPRGPRESLQSGGAGAESPRLQAASLAAPATSLSTCFLTQVDNSPSVPGEKTHPCA